MNKVEKDNSRGFILLIAVLICHLLLLKLVYAIPLKDSSLWYCGVFLSFYIPGSLLIRYFVFRKNDFFPRAFYSLALGVAFMPLIYTIFRIVHFPNLIFYFIASSSLVWLVLSIKDFRAEKNYYISAKDVFSSCILISFVFLLLHLSYFTDIIFLEQGFKLRTSRFTETVFHLGIINNLQDLYPPLYPYASGYSFSYYHLNMHLEIEMFHRLFSVDTMKLTFFYFPSLYFTLLVFLPYFFVLEIGGTRMVGVLTGILLFGSDLSFVMGLFSNVPWDYPWINIYNPAIWSILTLNGMLPALIVMFLFILFLLQFDVSGKRIFLIILCMLGYSAYGFKSSMGFHLMAALFLAGVATVYIAKDKREVSCCVARQ